MGKELTMVRGAGHLPEARRHADGCRGCWLTGWRVALAAVGLLCVAAPAAAAQEAPPAAATEAQSGEYYVPDISAWLPQANSRESLSKTMQVVVVMTLLTVAPSIILMMTCFVRMVVVLVLLRQALGAQQLPPSQVLIGLALFMTFLVMAPTWERVRSRAVDPYLDGKLAQLDAVAVAGSELRDFMFTQIEAAGNEEDVYMMYEYATERTVPMEEEIRRPDVPMTALIPAFILSELKTGFVLGFRIFLPFLVIDMVIATMLVSMGMMMLPPVLISLPFKLLLFVLADGWHLVVTSLLTGFA